MESQDCPTLKVASGIVRRFVAGGKKAPYVDHQVGRVDGNRGSCSSFLTCFHLF